MAWMKGKRMRKEKKVDCWRFVLFWTVIFFFFYLKLTGATDKGDYNIFGR